MFSFAEGNCFVIDSGKKSNSGVLELKVQACASSIMSCDFVILFAPFLQFDVRVFLLCYLSLLMISNPSGITNSCCEL